MSVYYRKMDGTEGASVSWTLSADDETSAVLMRFRGRDFATDPPEASGGSAVNSDTFDPPSVTPSSSGEYIVLTMTSYFLGTSATPPAGYGQVVLTDATRSNPQSGWFVTKAFKTITTSEDPGTGTFNDTGRLGTVTVAVLLTDKSAPVATGDHTHAVAQSLAFSKTGTLEVTTGASKFPALFDMTLIGVRAAVGTAPTGADLIVDVNLNGTTVYTTQGNRPTISDGSTSSTETVPDVTAVAAGDLLSVDIDQVGSSTAGSDLVVAIEFQEA
jgi:hypothetical protein